MRTGSCLGIDTLTVQPQSVCGVSFSSPMKPSMFGHTFYQPGTVKHMLTYAIPVTFFLFFISARFPYLCISPSICQFLSMAFTVKHVIA